MKEKSSEACRVHFMWTKFFLQFSGETFGRHFPQIVVPNQTKFFVRNKSDTTEILFSWATSCVSHASQSVNFLATIKDRLYRKLTSWAGLQVDPTNVLINIRRRNLGRIGERVATISGSPLRYIHCRASECFVPQKIGANI